MILRSHSGRGKHPRFIPNEVVAQWKTSFLLGQVFSFLGQREEHTKTNLILCPYRQSALEVRQSSLGAFNGRPTAIILKEILFLLSQYLRDSTIYLLMIPRQLNSSIRHFYLTFSLLQKLLRHGQRCPRSIHQQERTSNLGLLAVWMIFSILAHPFPVCVGQCLPRGRCRPGRRCRRYWCLRRCDRHRLNWLHGLPKDMLIRRMRLTTEH